MEKIKSNIKKRKMKVNIGKKLLNLKVFFSVILLTFMITSIVSASNSESYKPYLHKPSVGQYPKLEMYGNYQTHLFTGSASYSYELITPPGVKGLSPQLSISYNSQSAFQSPSIVGAGWTFTSNYILRNINFSLINTTDDFFIINLNGYSDKIFYKSGAYKTQIDTYLRIENKTSGGNQYWLITSTDGTKYNFGLNNASLMQSNASNYTLKWFLES